VFVDASALVAIIAEEEDGAELAGRLDQAPQAYTSPVALYETTLGLVRILRFSIADADSILVEFLERTGIQIVPITAEIGRGAIGAFQQFGRGRHAARLNMGDCFAYACAQALDVPLLFKGDDFSQTDIAVA
jgi:ribonuclease VapC